MHDARAYEAELLERLEMLEAEKEEAERQFDEQVNKVLQAVTGCDLQNEEKERTLYTELENIRRTNIKIRQ